MRNRNAELFSAAPFTMLLLAANVGLFLVSAMMSKSLFSVNLGVLSKLGASQREGLWEGEWIRLIAPMFLHGGLLHIFMNMSFLWSAGPATEVYFGTPNYGTIYLLSGATGVCLSQIFGGHLSIGASGSLCGIMGAHLAVLILKTPVRRYAWRNAQVRAETFNLLILLGIGLTGFMSMDNWGHLGGMLAGFALGASFELWREQSVIGKLGVFATLISVAVLVCAARWTAFNPTYHIYEVAVATEEEKDPEAAKLHAAEARKWAGIWTPLHFLGVLNVGETDTILRAYTQHKWTLEKARNPGRGAMLGICLQYKYPGLWNIPDAPEPAEDSDPDSGDE